MQASFHIPGFGLLLLLALAGPPAFAQTTSPPAGNLTLPSKQHGTGTATKPPTAPQAAPRTPVHQVGPGSAPVIQPHGQTHAVKPGAQKPPAKGPAKPGTPPVVVAPVPTPEPAAPAAPAEPTKGSATGNPLPRFASLRTDEVNLRRGPGTRYPIDWVYKRRDLPVEIEREFEVWRLVTDPDGTKGWVHQATLTGRRSFIVTGAERVLRHEASDTSAPVARLKPGVIGHIRSCDGGSDWCQMQVGEYRGYLKREEFWGALPNEAISN
jgi:SH3-like domain-containing protein